MESAQLASHLVDTNGHDGLLVPPRPPNCHEADVAAIPCKECRDARDNAWLVNLPSQQYTALTDQGGRGGVYKTEGGCMGGRMPPCFGLGGRKSMTDECYRILFDIGVSSRG